MPIVAAGVAVAAAVGGGIAKSQAAKKAASAQAAGAESASLYQRLENERQREDIFKNQEDTKAMYQPFLQSGTNAQNQLSYQMGLGGTGTGEAGGLARSFTMADYQADPGYAFRLSEGQKALDRTNSAKGKYFSGEAIKGLTDYNQKSASQEYQNAYDRYNINQTNLYNRLAGISNTGMNAAGVVADTGMRSQGLLSGSGTNMVNAVNENKTGAGNAYAAGKIGAANAQAGAFQGISNAVSSYVGGMGGAGGMMGSSSDRRLKENIKKVGEDKGFNIYEFNYIGRPEKYRGVMAQEVIKTRPDAVINHDGFLRVFYDKIGLKMEAVCQ